MNMDENTSGVSSSKGRTRRVLLFIAGSFFLLTGAVGVVLPVLPTTPFLILAAFCYARSSSRCYRWLLNNRVFGRYLNDYLCGRGIPWRVKALALFFLWGVISVTAVIFVERMWLRVLLFVVAVGVTGHVLLLKSRKGEGA
jgi:uncharacterized membrane protein YbaN (DUF454 family)